MSEGKKEILLGDCLELMKEIPDMSIDLILADLPYGTTACNWDNIIPMDKLWEQYKRIRKPNAAILLFASQPFATDLINSNRAEFKYELLWIKNQWSNHVNGKRQPLKGHELILVFYKEQPIFNPQRIPFSDSTIKRYKNGETVKKSGVIGDVYRLKSQQFIVDYEKGRLPSSILDYKCVHNGNGTRLHPTQKPTDLLLNLINTYTNEGDTVLDNTAGSGSTGIAALFGKRNFILIEKEEKYFEIIKKRVADFNKNFEQKTLFENEM